MSTLSELCYKDERAEQMNDPGTYEGGILSSHQRKAPGTASVMAVTESVMLRDYQGENPSRHKNKAKTLCIRTLPTCRSCRVTLGKSIWLARHSRRCPDKTKADEIEARGKERDRQSV